MTRLNGWRGKAATVVTVLALMPGAGAAQSLADALVAAYNHSGLIEQNRATLRAADEDVASAVARLRPTLDYLARWSYTFGPAVPDAAEDLNALYQVSANYTLYDYGRNALQIGIAKETVLATREALIGIEQGVLDQTIDAYMSVQSASAVVQLRQSNERLIRQELRAAQDRFEVGEVTRTDVELARARLAQAQANLAASQGDLRRAQAAYEQAVGRKPGRLTTTRSIPHIPDSPAAARNIARSEHPSVRRIQRQIRARELGIELAEANLLPTVSAGGSISFDGNFDRTDQLSLSISGPISRGGALNSAIRRAIAQRDAEIASLHVERHSREFAVEAAYAQLAVARATLAATDDQVRAARTAFQGVREEARLGARTTLDVLDAEQSLLDAQTQAVRAQFDEVVAAYDVLFSIGRLTTKNLGLHVESYDPEAYYNLVKDAPQSKSVRGAALDRVLESLGKK
ncbi:MAG: TolC family outer membrane protein [Shimia sp.]